ncbi:MAG: hypothetical protein IKO25_09195 [Clostridia bacterium]|nr:hypothetical protein [Clostridia bacterium]
MANQKIRDQLQKAKLHQWQLADALGVHEAVLCRKLRHELSTDETEKIIGVIKRVSEEKQNGQH